MKLTEGRLVQWKEGNAWMVGRVMLEDDGSSVRYFYNDLMQLVRYSFTHELEFVLGARLMPAPEKHSEE